MRAIAALAVWILVSGCYRYYPAATPIPPAGVRVAAELSDSGTVVLARTVGPGVSTVEGRVVRADTEEIELSVTTVRQHDGRESGWRGERITVPRTLVAGLQERKFSRSRTVFFAVAFAAAGVALQQAFDGDSGGSPRIWGGGGIVPR